MLLKIVCLLMRWLFSLAVGVSSGDRANQSHLRAVLADYQEHYNTARPHQGIGQRVPNGAPSPPVAVDPGTCQIHRKPILSGLINEYARAA